jgi:hypothetical protein
MDKMSEKDQLYWAIKAFLKGQYPVKEFCSNFERIYNLELDKKVLTDTEKQAFDELFNTVVYDSPFPEERKNYAGHKDEQDIQKAVEKAAKELSLSL